MKEVKEMEDRPRAGDLLKQIDIVMKKQANNMLKSMDLTIAQVIALMILRQEPSGELPLKKIEQVMRVAQSTAAGIVARLEKKGFVESFDDENDRRIKMVRITPTGLSCCERAYEHVENTEEMLLSSLTETERVVFVALLQKVSDSLM